jgi:hypothetical protein
MASTPDFIGLEFGSSLQRLSTYPESLLPFFAASLAEGNSPLGLRGPDLPGTLLAEKDLQNKARCQSLS